MIHNYVITGFTCLLAGFILGWLACETRVWRQIKKHEGAVHEAVSPVTTDTQAAMDFLSQRKRH